MKAYISTSAVRTSCTASVPPAQACSPVGDQNSRKENLRRRQGAFYQLKASAYERRNTRKSSRKFSDSTGGGTQTTLLHAALFGQARFAIDCEPIRLASRPKVLPMLAYLLLHRERPTSRDSLAFLLWEDESEEVARSNLRRHLNHLTSALPKTITPWLVVDSEIIQWNPKAPLWLDVSEFERLVTTAEGRPQAIELYAGDLLESLYDEWLFAPRQRLQDLYIGALGELIVEARGRRDVDAARTYAQRILSVDPWREDAVRELMSVRYECGDRSGALATFEEFERRLRNELQTDVMPETLAVRDAIVHNMALPMVAQPIAADTKPTAHALPFAGREKEMARLRAAWSRAIRGRGGLITIGGEAGVGKTRLVTEFALSAEREGGRVLWGTTTLPESVPYQPVAEALRAGLGLIAALDIEPIWLAALAQLLPELIERGTDLPLLPQLDLDRERARLFEAIVRCIVGLARTRPLVIVLEDTHWAGTATIALIETIVRRVAERDVLLLLTFRDDEIDPSHALIAARKRLIKEERGIHVALGRLDEPSVSSIVNLVPAIAMQGEALASKLYTASEGNALFLSELIREVVESQHDAEIGSLPSGLHATVVGRIARLSGEAQSLLELGAVAGSAFDVETVRNVSGWDEAQLEAAIDELVARHLLREAGRRGGFDLAFAHHLIHASIYADIPADVRRRWHHRIAHVTEERYANRPEHAALIARHFEAAGEGERAAQHFLRAARAAFDVYANDEASLYARRGLELVEKNSVLKYDLLAILETSDGLRADRASQKGVLEVLEKTALALNDRERFCAALRRRIDYCRLIAERDREIATIRELIREANDLGDQRWIASALEAEATYNVNLGMREEALSLITRAADLYESLDDDRGLVFSLTLQAHLASYRGDQMRAEHCIARAKAIAGVRNDASLLMRVLTCEGHVYFYTEQWKRYRDVAVEALELARTIGDRDGEANVCAALATVSNNLGEIGTARTCFSRAIEIQKETGRAQGLGTTYVNAAALEVEAGRADEAEKLVNELERIAHTIGWPQGVELCAIKRSEIAQLRGHFTESLAAASAALASARDRKSRRDEAGALREVGRAHVGLREYRQAVAYFEESLQIFRDLDAHEEKTETLADLALAHLEDGNAEAARNCAKMVVADIDKLGRGIVAIHALWSVARVLRATGDAVDADEYLARAREAVNARANAYPDPESQTAFVRIAEHAAIIAASERHPNQRRSRRGEARSRS